MPFFQDNMPNNHCFGCGPDNDHGLQIQSHWSDDDPSVAVCRFQPAAHHCAGPTKFLNGGVIATVIDCHSVCTAVAETYRRAGRDIGQGEPIYFATGRLEIDYLRPVPIHLPITLRASAGISTEKSLWVECTLESDGKPRAKARVEAVQVPSAWMA